MHRRRPGADCGCFDPWMTRSSRRQIPCICSAEFGDLTDFLLCTSTGQTPFSFIAILNAGHSCKPRTLRTVMHTDHCRNIVRIAIDQSRFQLPVVSSIQFWQHRFPNGNIRHSSHPTAHYDRLCVVVTWQLANDGPCGERGYKARTLLVRLYVERLARPLASARIEELGSTDRVCQVSVSAQRT